ncbi:G-protein coupled receptor dmsr-1-like [Dreissena polymorpha]|uniref:G-protein coupled receptor dmsr-1-like n=1 Tax=Dreissena polymorpha TaxID=45954 RepID=UPI002265648E|nr:G-protein coupled receptor dmsr-1-like [Dreissena polymorpha]
MVPYTPGQREETTHLPSTVRTGLELEPLSRTRLSCLRYDDFIHRYTYFWSIYLNFHSCLSNTTHTVSLWLAVVMSAVRYLFIRSRGRLNLSIPKTQLAICGVYVAVIMVLIPNYSLSGLEPSFVPAHNTTVYKIKSLQIYLKNSTTMNAINVWLFVLVGKFIPCVLICVLGCMLLKTIQQSVQLTESLKLTSCSRRMRAHRRTTIMLLAIMALFIISSFPVAILMLISVFVDGFFMDYYMLFADTLDILSLINNAINFVMYCSMSRQFRDSLCETLPLCKLDSGKGVYQSTATTTNVRASAVTHL